MVALIGNAMWRDSAFSMLLLLAGLKSIPPQLYDAARIDGSNAIYSFRRITLPLLRVPILITLVRLLLQFTNIFTYPLILTGGGPGNSTETLVLRAWRVGFQDYSLGRANAMAMLLLVFNVAAVVGLVLLFRRRQVAQ